MRFIDECEIRVEAGNGGNGCAAFRREKYVPFGGPAGGDGGNGGDVVFVADSGLGTLYDFTHQRVLRANHGEAGMGKDCNGRAGKDLLVRVPVGTIVFDREQGTKLFELLRPGEQMVVARGGRGGRGNKHFATPVDRAPRRAEPGKPGEHLELRLELKVMADVGLVGFPNVGKSTFISAVSRAHPKIANYPFTTLEPHLGVVVLNDGRGGGAARTFVVADIPGLIPGASEGHGLGIRFLKHLERTRVLLHLLTDAREEGRSLLEDYQVIRKELAAFSPELAQFPEIVAMTKSDLPNVREVYDVARREFADKGIELHLVSAATHEGLDALLQVIAEQLGV